MQTEAPASPAGQTFSVPLHEELHLLALHASLPGQATPPSPAQPPQLAGSVLVSVHAAPHSVPPEGQTQAPAEQLWPLVQALLHLPQLALSDWVFVQVVPHCVLPPGQPWLLQLPLRQASPDLQALPHVPQFAGSFWVLVQLVPHWVWLVGQEDAHLLAVQTWPLLQGLPQPLQFWLSVEVSVHVPLQAVWPVAQTSWQLPPVQLFPPEQTVPQPPQFWLSEFVSVQVPLQSVEPPVQPWVLPPSMPVGVLPLEQATSVATAKSGKSWIGRRMKTSDGVRIVAPLPAGRRNL